METECLFLLNLEDSVGRWREELTPRPQGELQLAGKEASSVHAYVLTGFSVDLFAGKRGKTAEQGQAELPLEGSVASRHWHKQLCVCGSPSL